MTGFVPSPEQRRVIEHGLTPLRVSAGAGTGKTTTMAHRIAGLVTTHGIDPEQVLGVTFTNKAAEELAGRVTEVLGDSIEPSRQVDIHTYHGFAAQLLGEFGALVGVERSSSVITPTFTRQILSDIVRALPFPNLNQTAPNLVDQIRKMASAMSDHLVTTDSVRALASDGEPWPARLDLLAAIDAYAAAKRRLGVVDYGDLIARAERLVAEHPWVADRVRARFRAVVLDEYQDTNPAQRRLLLSIFGGGFPVTAVGDADQTIYEWRGASPSNFAGFPAHFRCADGSDAADLPLSVNRRSAPEILALANRIRSKIDPRPRLALTAADQAPPGEVRTSWFDDAVGEAEWIADDLHESHGAGRAWSDHAVLFRKNKDMALVRDALTNRDIPVEVANLGGLMSIPEVVDLHAWLRVLEWPEDGPALARLLTGSRYRLGLGDLAVLARAVRLRRPDDDEPMVVPHTLLEALEDPTALAALRTEARAAVAAFASIHRKLVQAAQGVTLVELCRRILDLTGAWRDVEAMSPAGRLSARLNLYRFLDLAEEWSPLEGRPSLGAFLDYLATMDQEPAEELDTARLAGADAVTLVTVHRAKGLEWPVVYLPAAYRNNFPSSVGGPHDNPHTRPESLPHALRIDRADLPDLASAADTDAQAAMLRSRHESQEWRIAYVAATRAKEVLTVTGASWYGNPEPTKRPSVPSELFHLVADHEVTRVLSSPGPAPPRPETIGYRTERLPAPDPVFGDGGWQGALRSTIADPSVPTRRAAEIGVERPYDALVTEYEQLIMRLPDRPDLAPVIEAATSVTGLVTYASCPRRYFWSEVDRLPRRPSPAARRGVEVHRRIELFHRGVIPPDESQPTLYDTTPAEASDPPPPHERPFDVFTGSRFAEVAPFLVEAPFEIALGTSTRVRGRVDAIYRTGDHWEIVDFKSGRPSSDPAVGVQLQAYAMAVARGGFSVTPPDRIDVTFAYLGGGLTERSETVDAAWLTAAEHRLDQLAEGIEAARFDPEPSASCHRCDFLRFCPAGRAEVGR